MSAVSGEVGLLMSTASGRFTAARSRKSASFALPTTHLQPTRRFAEARSLYKANSLHNNRYGIDTLRVYLCSTGHKAQEIVIVSFSAPPFAKGVLLSESHNYLKFNLGAVIK